MPKGKPVRPKWLKGRGAKLWDEVLAFAFWLTIADSYKLAAWCDRQSEFERKAERASWTAADRREHRAAGSELGLDVATRTLFSIKEPLPSDDPAAKFFT
jgi:hypothetical protein